MGTPIRIPLFVIAVTLLSACASHKIQYDKAEKNWMQLPLPNKPLEHQVFLIGDVSSDNKITDNSSLKLLLQKAKIAGKNSSVVFLGNNIYPEGMPPKNDPKRRDAERILQSQLDLLKEFAGKISFIPGHRDWVGKDGVKSVQEQELFIEKSLGKKAKFLPNDGCSGPTVKEVSNTTVMIVIDSQWYLENWDTKEGINENCELRTRSLFFREVMDKIKDNRHKNIILAMHHPLNSNGPYGGHYSAKHHFFPLANANNNVYLPLPGIGSIVAFLKSSISSRQELKHPNYQELKMKLIDISEKFTNVIFVAGHEHSLQYFEEEDLHFIISGAGAKQTPVALGGDASFVAGVKGFSNLNIYEDGEVWVEFWATSTKSGQELLESELIFRKKVRPPLSSLKELIPAEFPAYIQLKNQDSVLQSVMEPNALKIHNQTFWGHLYTADYLTDFKVPILDLSKEKGGLIAISKGGGNQTNSIRLKSKAGKFYQLRSIEKVTERFPRIVRKTFANDLAKQELTAGNPFSAVVVGPMAASINVFHTNPRIVYVPKQPNLGKFNNLGGAIYLFEERGNGDWSDLTSFGHTKKVENMGKVIQRKLKNGKTVIDQAQVLRSRLLDMIIGDWDRHQDQWRWASYELDNGKTLYKPIPRDRDQAYAKFDGIANAIANYTVPFTRAADKFNGEISKRETTWLNYQARHFDRLFLTKMTLADWEREAKFIQQNLKDGVIKKAIQKLPPFAFQRDGEKLIKWTKMRRDDLLKVARNYYKILNKEVNIFGTHQSNLFVINRLNDFQVEVTVFETNDKNDQSSLIFERTFETSVTNELRLYGLDGDDRFIVKGQVNKSTLVRLIGGNGTDIYEDESKVKGLKSKTKIYDELIEASKLKLSDETKDNRSDQKMVNTFNFMDYEYNYTIPIPLIGSNPDDGFFVSLNMNWNTFSFKRKQIHKISGLYAFGTSAFQFGYEADYFNMLNHWDTYLKVVAEVPRSVSNFHGLGNETKRDIDALGRDYYRVRRTLYGAYPAFKRRTDGGATFSIGPTFESIKIENMEDRFTNRNLDILPTAVFNQQYFGGSDIYFNYTNADHAVVPTQGLGFKIGTEWRANLNDLDRQMVKLNSAITIYNRLTENDFLVLSNRLGWQHIIGEYDFFQAANLGGTHNLRGYAQERFSGRTAFYHNIDLRIKIFDSENNVVPISGGITPGFDYGRVWIDNDNSDKWHTAYGGTIWIAPLDYIAFSAGMYFSENENRLILKAGFQF